MRDHRSGIESRAVRSGHRVALLMGLLAIGPAWAGTARGQATATGHVPLAERPLRMEKDIEAFEEQDRLHPPPKHAVLLTGASSLRLWKNVSEALAPHPVINRGFGGSYTTEVLGYMDRITLPYEPRVVVYHCGGNDIAAGDPPDAPLGRIRESLVRLGAKQPDTAVVVMATTRAASRRAKWPELDRFNRELAAFCKNERNVWFVDINAVLADADGEPRKDFFLDDRLHPSAAGYVAIASVLKPAVDAAWQATAAASPRRP
ncbi:MAG: GDSL-type esterase/lipase family protein [Planctomycetia bacterium]